MELVRAELFEGKLSLPSYQSFVEAIGPEYTDLADKFMRTLWHQYLLNKGSVSLPYWSDRFDNPQVFNIVLVSLSDAGWIQSHSIPARNWAEANLKEEKLLQYVPQLDLERIRATFKFSKYISSSDESTKSTATRLNGKVMNTGIVREGFMKAGNTKYQLATEYIDDYYDVIKLNCTKSMDKIAKLCPNLRHDRASYDTISVEILNYHQYHRNETFTRGNNYNDSRGRAISSGLSKVFNPISNKDARSLLVIPE